MQGIHFWIWLIQIFEMHGHFEYVLTYTSSQIMLKAEKDFQHTRLQSFNAVECVSSVKFSMPLPNNLRKFWPSPFDKLFVLRYMLRPYGALTGIVNGNIYFEPYEKIPEPYAQFYIFSANQPFVTVRGKRYVLANWHPNRCRTLRKYCRIITYPCSIGQTLQINVPYLNVCLHHVYVPAVHSCSNEQNNIPVHQWRYARFGWHTHTLRPMCRLLLIRTQRCAT